MATSITKPSGWAVNEKLTSAQMTAVDINAGSGLDKRTGETDTLDSTISVTGTISADVTDAIVVANGGSIGVEEGSIEVETDGAINIQSGGLIDVKTGGQLLLSGTNKVSLASRSVTRKMGMFHPDDPTQWTNIDGFFQTDTTSAAIAWVDLDLPHNSTLTALSVSVSAGSGHGGLPAVMPAIRAYQMTDSDSVAITVSTSDTSASVGAFQSTHSISVSGLSVLIDRSTSRYALRFTSESGLNAADDLLLFSCTATVTMTQMDDFVA